MAYSEDDLVAISALQHLLFCPRQCALIHNEQSWSENRYTAEGQVLHKNAESGKSTTRNGIRITRDLPLHCLTYGLIGKADIVEFHPPPDISPNSASRTLKQWILNQKEISLEGWTILPIEYKRGQPKENNCDRVQLCAQALCLEEMLQVSVSHGYLFYGQKQHRYEVLIDDVLRKNTLDTIAQMHELIASRSTPPAEYGPKCKNCSLYDLCLPQTHLAKLKTSTWFQEQLNQTMK
jgi:CRISPR-associated exonuclease Cas4